MATGRPSATYNWNSLDGQLNHNPAMMAAEQLYARAARPAWMATARERLQGHSQYLQALADTWSDEKSVSRQELRLQSVPIANIIGSAEQARSHDFDQDFRPRNRNLKERWLNIAATRQQGRSLPPVELFQVGDQYFVVDGHHRVSVERALGSTAIAAHVTLLARNT